MLHLLPPPPASCSFSSSSPSSSRLLKQIKIQMLTKHNQYEGFFFCSSICTLPMIDDTHLFHHFRVSLFPVSRTGRIRSLTLFPLSSIVAAHEKRYHQSNIVDVSSMRYLLLSRFHLATIKHKQIDSDFLHYPTVALCICTSACCSCNRRIKHVIIDCGCCLRFVGDHYFAFVF